MTLGPVMADLVGATLTAQERDLLQHPQIGGVILFARNYVSIDQLVALVTAIHELRRPRLLVGVDQEGGRVQRLRAGFIRLPAARRLGQIFDQNRAKALKLASTTGWLMGVELRAAGIDFSFAPVLDLDREDSRVIGDRALHRDPRVVAELAHQYITGMRRAGLIAVGKHFPGHGSVKEDPHIELPVDQRPVANILAEDVLTFERVICDGLAGVMSAHVVYPYADSKPAGYSRYWLQDVLRQRLGFQGAIFSDDLNMQAAACAGDHGDRAATALAAGCDMVLVCNNPSGAAAALARLEDYEMPASQSRLRRLHGQQGIDYREVRASSAWRAAEHAVRALEGPAIFEMDL